MRELRNYPKWRPFALEIIARDFALAAPYRRIAISFVAGTLKPLRWPPQIMTLTKRDAGLNCAGGQLLRRRGFFSPGTK
jgi:hypothetical protein